MQRVAQLVDLLVVLLGDAAQLLVALADLVADRLRLEGEKEEGERQ